MCLTLFQSGTPAENWDFPVFLNKFEFVAYFHKNVHISEKHSLLNISSSALHTHCRKLELLAVGSYN